MDAAVMSEREIGRVTIVAEREYLPGVLAFLCDVTGQLGLAAPDVANLARAVEEVSLNVIERGFTPGQGGSFDLAILRRPGQVVVVVEDRGLPFDFASLEADPGDGAPGALADRRWSTACASRTSARAATAWRS